MTTFTRQIVARMLGASLLGLATIALGGSVAHAGPGLHSDLAWRLIAEDPPAGDGEPATDGTDGSTTEAPAPEPTATQSSPAPADAGNDNQGNQNDTGNDNENNNSQSDDHSTADKAPVPTTPTYGASPEPSETPQPRTVLVSEHGPSPLGWVLLAAGVIFAGAAGAYYLRKRPFDDPEEEPEPFEAPQSFDPQGPDTEELEAVPAEVDDPLEPVTEEMHIVPLGLDAPPRPDSV